MTVVFVHGVPDNAAVWDALRARIPDRRTVALSLPGFGCPRPQGFEGSRWEYRDWLECELRAIGEPVHVVAHDLGSVAAQGLLQTAPELFRSWVLTGVCHPGFAWHLQGRIWQTQKLGEQSRDLWLSLPVEQRIEVLRSGGIPEFRAPVIAEYFDEAMFDCVLGYYRSVAFFGDWQLQADANYPPGMVVWGITDEFQGPEYGLRLANLLGIRFVGLPCGHWWQVDEPARGAAAILGFWVEVESGGGA